MRCSTCCSSGSSSVITCLLDRCPKERVAEPDASSDLARGPWLCCPPMTETGVALGLLALRCMVGFTMFAHGYNHVWGGGKIAGTARWFESLGLKPGILHAWMA